MGKIWLKMKILAQTTLSRRGSGTRIFTDFLTTENTKSR